MSTVGLAAPRAPEADPTTSCVITAIDTIAAALRRITETDRSRTSEMGVRREQVRFVPAERRTRWMSTRKPFPPLFERRANRTLGYRRA